MIDYYKKFFERNISSVFLVEIAKPFSIELPHHKQVELIFEHAFLKDVNSATIEMYYGNNTPKKSELINQSITEVWEEKEYKEESGTIYQFYKNFVESDYEIKNIESQSKTPRGDIVWFLVSMHGIVEDGLLVGYWGSQLDISKLKAVQSNLEITNGKLKEKIEETKGFAYLSTHNLQTPLENMRNFSSLLLDTSFDLEDVTVSKSLKFINESANKMSLMLKELVRYFDLEDRHSISEVDVHQLVDELIHSEFSKDRDKVFYNDLPIIFADRDKLKLLFRILIDNSFVHNKASENLKINIESKNIDNVNQFKVIDNGKGISVKDQPQVFAINKSNLDYTKGLGLTIARKIVNQHHGKISLSSIPDQETAFTFTIEDATD